MKKQDALDFIKLQKGYIPFIGIFDLYDDNDEIPKNLIDLYLKKQDLPPGSFIICSSVLAEELKKINLK